MAEQPEVADPRIEWTEGDFRVSLPLEDGMIDAMWRPGTTTVVRINERRSTVAPPNSVRFASSHAFKGYSARVNRRESRQP